jgi:predicted Zn-dependent protease with MMP-like domain/Flp pilus assembly protein TadD
MADLRPVLDRPPRSPFLALSLAAALLACARQPTAVPPPAVARPPQASAPSPRAQGQLASVRPLPAPCLGRGKGSATALANAAEDELDRGDAERALACADEALRGAPRFLPALRARAAALGDLDRAAEARLAWARALAIAPGDPETLLGAADFFVARERRDHAALELGLEYALRGAEAAERRRDGELAASLHVLAAMAENDLGDSREALDHADAALAARADDVDAQYERGVALYELCRFAEARAALEHVLARAPEDAWALHQLALVAERTGDSARADELERRARRLAPDEFPPPVSLDRRAFEAEVRRAVDALPPVERRALSGVPVEVEDVPALDDLVAVDPPLSPSILGLYRGPPENEACLPDDGERCRSIVFYRKNLVRYARSEGELVEQVRVTLLHELGHLHGETDDDLRARGLE